MKRISKQFVKTFLRISLKFRLENKKISLLLNKDFYQTNMLRVFFSGFKWNFKYLYTISRSYTSKLPLKNLSLSSTIVQTHIVYLYLRFFFSQYSMSKSGVFLSRQKLSPKISFELCRFFIPFINLVQWYFNKVSRRADMEYCSEISNLNNFLFFSTILF